MQGKLSTFYFEIGLSKSLQILMEEIKAGVTVSKDLNNATNQNF